MFAYGNMIRYGTTIVDLTSNFFVFSLYKRERLIYNYS